MLGGCRYRWLFRKTPHSFEERLYLGKLVPL